MSEMFHRHQWYEMNRSYTPNVLERAAAAGASDFSTGRYANQDAKDRDMHGFTTVELKCVTCGDVMARYLLGDSR